MIHRTVETLGEFDNPKTMPWRTTGEFTRNCYGLLTIKLNGGRWFRPLPLGSIPLS